MFGIGRREATPAALARAARALSRVTDIEPLAQLAARAEVVLLGEATHGSAEFYRCRAALTQRLIIEHGFDAIAVEADWPAALRASRYAQGISDDADGEQALVGFERFPRWMWRNTETLALLEWLREHNRRHGPARRVGFFGLDLYSLRESMRAVLDYLDQADPPAAARARARYGCFDELADDPQAYGHAVSFGLRKDCEREVVAQLRELLDRHQRELLGAATAPDGDEHFYAQQNARVVRNAETYYRSMFAGRVESWNVRDRHMASTLLALRAHLSRRHRHASRVVVWAHNSHVGDGRATELGRPGQLTLGQLVRQQHAAHGDALLLGFTTHEGSVAAAADWDAPVEFKQVLPSRPDSVERLLHDAGREAGFERFWLPLTQAAGAPAALQEAMAARRLERAIGVIYRPDTERLSHYFEAALSRQFDAVVHFDRTQALHPLEGAEGWRREPASQAETWPSGL